MANGNQTNEILKDQFDPIRKRLQQQASRQRSQQERGIKRQFSRLGQTGSGAFIKSLQEAGRQEGEILQRGEEAIGAQESAEKRRLQEIERGREFTAEQAKIQRDFQSEEAKQVRDFQKVLEDQRLNFEKEKFENEKLTRAEQLELQKNQFAYEQVIGEFNMQLSRWEQNQPTDLVSSLIGGDIAGPAGGGAAIGGTLGFFAGGPVGAGIGAVVGGSLGSKLCFDPDTLVMMSDSTMKAIKDIKVGDDLLAGGKVYLTGAGITDELSRYKGVKVTQSHAVFDNGQWSRIRDLDHEKIEGKYDINFISCENHIMLIDGIEFRDFDEVDNTHLYSEDQCLKIMNEEEVASGTN